MHIRTNRRAACAAVTILLSVAVSRTGLGQGAPKLQSALVARSQQPGEVVRLDLSCACDLLSSRATATVFGREVPLFPVTAEEHWRGLIGIDLGVRPGVYSVRILIDRVGEPPLRRTHTLRVAAKRFPTRRLRVAGHFVEPAADEIERIRRENERLQALYRMASPRIWEGPFLFPVSQRATANFGVRSIFNGQPRAPHGGLDFESPAGTPVRSPAAGTVALAEELFFTGNTVVIDHGLGLYSVLAHLSVFTVAEGDPVERGQIVGEVGATGRATGPHLHWGVRLNGARVDPASLVAATE